MRSGTIVTSIVCLFLGGCQNPQNATADANDTGAMTEDASATEPLPMDAAKATLICKAGIAELFQQPATAMKAEPMAGGVIRVSYRRSSDNILWKNDCKIDRNRIVWRAVNVSPGSGPGRWRDDPEDGIVTFKIEGGQIEVVETF